MARLSAALVVIIALAMCASVFALDSDSTLNRRLRRGALTDDAERILRQGSNIDTNNVGQLVDLVERNRAEECLARVICELSNNAKSHGDAGARFARSLLKFRQSKHPKVKQYLDAMSNGAKAKSAEQCRQQYARCSHQTNEVIQVGNKLLRA